MGCFVGHAGKAAHSKHTQRPLPDKLICVYCMLYNREQGSGCAQTVLVVCSAYGTGFVVKHMHHFAHMYTTTAKQSSVAVGAGGHISTEDKLKMEGQSQTG